MKPNTTDTNPADPYRKTRSDAILKKLPPEQQDGIVEYARTRTLAETAEWLRGADIAVSHQTVSEFLRWHAMRRQLTHNRSARETLRGEYPAGQSRENLEELDRLGHCFFLDLALEKSDYDGWQSAQNVRLKQHSLQLEGRRLDLLEKKLAQAAELDSGTLTPEEQRARLREILQ